IDSSDQKLEHLVAAVNSATMHVFNQWQIRSELTRILLARKDFTKAREYLPPLNMAEEMVVVSWAEYLVASGQYLEADDLLKDALRMYPRNAALLDMLLQRNPLPSFFTRAYVENALQESRRYTDALLRLIESQSDPAVREDWFVRYFAMDARPHGSPRAAAMYFIDAVHNVLPDDEQRKRLEAFFAAGGGERWDLLSRILLSKSEMPDSIVAVFDAALESYTGVLYWHEAYVDLPVQWIEVDQGQIKKWCIDSTQDGKVDAEVNFVDGIPFEFLKHGKDEIDRYVFHFYPWVAMHEHENAADFQHRYFTPFSVELPVFISLPGADFQEWLSARPEMVVERGHRSDMPDQVLADHVRLLEESNQDGHICRTMYQKGKVIRQEWLDQNGVYAITEYHENEPLRSSESLQRDGYFDRAGVFQDGQLLAYAYDLDRDGAAEMWEYFDQARTQIWLIKHSPRLGLVHNVDFANELLIDILADDDEYGFPSNRILHRQDTAAFTGN
ncbi:MAG: hypothetical protein D6B26_02665, partial [Spirochaetaceae bacterium]